MATTYNVYASNSQELGYTKIAEGITEPTVNIEAPDPTSGGEMFVKVAEVNDAGEGFLSKPVKLTFIGEVPKPEILKYFYKGFLVQYKNATYASSMSLQASVNGEEFKTVDASNVAESFAIVDNIVGSCSLKTVCNTENSLRNGNTESFTPQDFILAGSGSTGRILRSTDAGANWNNITVSGMTLFPMLLSRFHDNICFCSQYGGTGGGGLFRSADGGLTWTVINKTSKIFGSITSLKNQVFLSAIGNNSEFSQIFLERSVDGGVSWTADKQIPCLAVFALNDSVVLLGTNNGILRSTDGGLTFNPTSINSGEYSLFTFAGNNAIIAAGSNIVRSIDGGLTWEIVASFSIPFMPFTSSVYLGNNISLIFADGNIKRSIDTGKTWKNTHNVGSAGFTSFANLGGGVVLFGGGVASGMYRSLDYGATWKIFRSGYCLGLC